jgi:hypothetical protein
MTKHVRYWLLLALINVGLFASMALEEQRYWRSTPRLAASPYETFSCTMLTREAMTPSEKETNWYWCCSECNPSLTARLVAIANLGAVILVALIIGIATRLGATNQVLIFYSVSPIAIAVWWFLVDWIVRHTHIRRRAAKVQ